MKNSQYSEELYFQRDIQLSVLCTEPITILPVCRFILCIRDGDHVLYIENESLSMASFQVWSATRRFEFKVKWWHWPLPGFSTTRQNVSLAWNYFWQRLVGRKSYPSFLFIGEIIEATCWQPFRRRGHCHKTLLYSNAALLTCFYTHVKTVSPYQKWNLRTQNIMTAI